jgi:TolA-binding protein
LGREQTRKGKYFLLCVAGLMAFSLSGCAGVREYLATRLHAEAPAETRKPEGKAGNTSVKAIDTAAKAEVPEAKQPEGKVEGPLVKAANTASKAEVPAARPPEEDAVQPEICEPQAGMESTGEACRHLLLGQKLLADGDFKGALRENQAVLALADKGPPGDEALFNMGLIYAHYDNPDKDYKKSIGYFKRLVRAYPRSSLREQAKIWVGVLDVIEKSKQVDIEIEMKKKEIGR